MNFWATPGASSLAIVLGALPVWGCIVSVPDEGDDDDGSSSTSSDDVVGSSGDGEDQTDGTDDDRESGSESGLAMCGATEAPCETHDDCPCFDGSMDVGTSLCVNDGNAGTCTDVCHENRDCTSGCCGALEGETEYGACAPAPVCEGGEVSERCLDGAVLFCACVNAAGVECNEDHLTTFFETCADPSSTNVEVFECWGDFVEDGLDACGAGLEVCDTE